MGQEQVLSAPFSQWDSKDLPAIDTRAIILILFKMGFFEAAHGSGWGTKRYPLPEICHTYPTINKIYTVILYLKLFQKIYESSDTHLEFY